VVVGGKCFSLFQTSGQAGDVTARKINEYKDVFLLNVGHFLPSNRSEKVQTVVILCLLIRREQDMTRKASLGQVSCVCLFSVKFKARDSNIFVRFRACLCSNCCKNTCLLSNCCKKTLRLVCFQIVEKRLVCVRIGAK